MVFAWNQTTPEDSGEYYVASPTYFKQSRARDPDPTIGGEAQAIFQEYKPQQEENTTKGEYAFDSRDPPEGQVIHVAQGSANAEPSTWYNPTQWFQATSRDEPLRVVKASHVEAAVPLLIESNNPREAPTAAELELRQKQENLAAAKKKQEEEAAKTEATQASSGWFSWFTFGGNTEEPERKEDDETVSNDTTISKLLGDLDSLPPGHDATSVAGSTGNFSQAATSLNGDAKSVKSVERNQGVDRMMANNQLRREKKEPEPSVEDARDVARRDLQTKRDKLVKELKSSITTFGRFHVRVALSSLTLADILADLNDFDSATKLHRDAVAIYSTKLGDDHKTTLAAKIRLGKILERVGDHESEVLDVYCFVTAMRRAKLGEKDPLVADSLVCLGHFLTKLEEHTQAIKELKRALKIYRESLGDGHAKVSQTVDDIASLYVSMGDYDKSAAILEEVVKLKAATQGPSSKVVADTLLDLAITYEQAEKHENTLKSLKKAYKIYTEIDGYSSLFAIDALSRVARTYEVMGDHNRASIAYLGVLRGRKVNDGAQALSVADVYYLLGLTLRRTNQIEKSLKCQKEAIAIYVSKGNGIDEVSRIADVTHEMALLNKMMRNFPESLRLLKQELSIRQRLNQPEFPFLARIYNHLGVVEYEMRNTSKALKYLVQSLTIFQEYGDQGTDCAEVLYNSGLVFEYTQSYSKALDAFEEAAGIFTVHGLKDTHPNLVKAHAKIRKMRELTGVRDRR